MKSLNSTCTKAIASSRTFYKKKGRPEKANPYYWSGRGDLNARPPAPKAGTLTRLRYAPTLIIHIYQK